MTEIEALEAQFDMTTREGMDGFHHALAVRSNLKKIEKNQIIFENTTYSVKMAMIWMLEETYSVADIEDQLREWLDTCPI